MKPSVPGILCILLSCLLASCAPVNNTNPVPITSISGNLVIYPDLQRNVLHPGDSVVFEFTLTGAALDINSVQINPGEPGAPIIGCGRNATCTEKTIRGQYTYKNKGYYNVSVQQNRQVLAGQRVLILENYLTDEELRYEAIKKIAVELKPVLQKVVRGKKVAFSALKNANFEYAPDQKDVEVIYGLMQALIEGNTRRSSYAILERAPHALVRLAHEAVYTAKNSNSRPEKQKQLEYGLSTFNKGLEQPLVYGIKPSGLDDVHVSNVLNSLFEEAKTESNDQSTRTADILKEAVRGQKESHSERPMMFARFDTADFLVVIERLEDDNRSGDELVERSKQDYYDTTYNAKAIKRTAKIKLNVRILDDNGRILWIKNITKQESDLVMPEYAPSVQTWAERKTRIPAQYPAINPFSLLRNVTNKVTNTVADKVNDTVNLIRTK